MRRLLIGGVQVAFVSGLWATLGMHVSSGQQQSGTAQHVTASKSSVPAPKPSDFVGSDTCQTCHSDVANKFSSNPHSRLALMHGGQGVTCESCHGPGKAHVENPAEPTSIRRFDNATAKEVNTTCLGCHAAAHPDFERSDHAKAGVSCTSCHSIHNAASEDALLKTAQPQLCYGCHTEAKAAFAQPFHHKVDEGLMHCSDCHDPHGTGQDKQLKTTAAQNAICTKCHTETGGPFVFEHPVLKTEGCVSCHSPHGSPNARLLNVANINTTCLQCHSGINNTAFPSAVSPTGPAHNQAAQYVACTSCHTQIHGSNASNIFFK